MKKYLPVLKHCPFFAGMDEGEILSILNCVDAKIRTFDHDEYIFRAGDSTASMGLILSGSVLVIQEDLWGAPEYHVQNRSRRLLCGTLRRNARFRFEHQRGNRRPSETLMLNINRLLTVCPTACTHHNRLIRNLVSVLAEKVLQFNEKITHMSRRTTREKLLSYLSSESIRQGSLSFDIPYDRQQLADYLCVERAAMSAELSKLQKEGLLTTRKNHFELEVERIRYSSTANSK